MSYNSPLKFQVANSGDFVAPALLVSGLILAAALFSPHPVAMTLFMILAIVTGWVLFMYSFSKVTSQTLTLVIFPDGSLGLQSAGQFEIEGDLQGQQWCNSQFAVLRYVSRGKLHSMVLLSAHQNADNYRRLLVWLRHDFLIRNEGRVQS